VEFLKLQSSKAKKAFYKEKAPGTVRPRILMTALYHYFLSRDRNSHALYRNIAVLFAFC